MITLLQNKVKCMCQTFQLKNLNLRSIHVPFLVPHVQCMAHVPRAKTNMDCKQWS